jgi:plasmid stabilization system protein ParE
MKFYVKILDGALADAEVIYGWIVKRSPQGAWHWYQAFLAAADSLDQDPEQHSKAPEFVASPVTSAKSISKLGEVVAIGCCL